jgi:hypothetical protein
MGWRRQLGNDGRARIRVSLEPRAPDDQPLISRSSPARKAIDPALVHALEAHVASLKTENERLAETLKAELEHRDTEIGALKTQLAGAETRASEEAANAAEAIAAFKSLTERLEAIALARRPLWHRLLWRG